MMKSQILHMQNNHLRNEQPVTVFGLGDNREYEGVIKGVASDELIPHYIVEMNYSTDYEYSCCVIPAVCIKECYNEKN